mgnify:CR=1 FL=1
MCDTHSLKEGITSTSPHRAKAASTRFCNTMDPPAASMLVGVSAMPSVINERGTTTRRDIIVIYWNSDDPQNVLSSVENHTKVQPPEQAMNNRNRRYLPPLRIFFEITLRDWKARLEPNAQRKPNQVKEISETVAMITPMTTGARDSTIRVLGR